MIREEIEQTKKGILLDLKGSKNLLVTFGGIQQKIGMPVFEFFNTISDIPCDKIFLRDFHQAWYQKGIDFELNHIDKVTENIKEIISKNQYDKLCFIGNSMGGYAAILFGSILNVNTVISFAPQTFIDRYNRLVNLDFRWNKQMSDIYSFKEKKQNYFDLEKHLSNNQIYNTQINIYYSKNHRLDKKHAERLKNERNVNLYPIKEGGHDVVNIIKDNGELGTVIKSSF